MSTPALDMMNELLLHDIADKHPYTRDNNVLAELLPIHCAHPIGSLVAGCAPCEEFYREQEELDEHCRELAKAMGEDMDDDDTYTPIEPRPPTYEESMAHEEKHERENTYEAIELRERKARAHRHARKQTKGDNSLAKYYAAYEEYMEGEEIEDDDESYTDYLIRTGKA